MIILQIVHITFFILIILVYLVAFKITHGRLARFEYGTKYILYFILYVILTIIYIAFMHEYKNNLKIEIFIQVIYYLFSLIIVFYFSKNVIKRFHDVGKSSIFALIVLIPIFGWIGTIIAFFADSQDDLNEHDISIDYKKVFPNIFEKLNIFVENNLTLIKINGATLFIKHENYKYTIIIKTSEYHIINYYIRENSPKFILTETTKYTFCRNIKKKELEKILIGKI